MSKNIFFIVVVSCFFQAAFLIAQQPATPEQMDAENTVLLNDSLPVTIPTNNSNIII